MSAYFSRAPNLHVPADVADAADIGGKGAGLLRLPPQWYPPTLFVSPRMQGEIHDDDLETHLSRIEWLPDALQRLVETTSTGKLLVRSSATDEDIDARGAYQTLECDANTASLAIAMRSIWNDSAGREVRVGFALQPSLDSKVVGHLSNEHRVSREMMQWAFECQLNTSMWRVSSASPVGNDALAATSVPMVESSLRRVARSLSVQHSRYHLEWVWDGNRVWIVQADPVLPVFGPAPGDYWFPAQSAAVESTQLKAWQFVNRDSLDGFRRWRKIANVEQFAKADLPVADLWVLNGAQLKRAMDSASLRQELDRDLDILCDGYLIIRSDTVSQKPIFLLPKAEFLASPSEAKDWMYDVLSDLEDQGVEAADVLFIAHRYLRSRASAWSRALPNDPNVRIDSTWGLPDGLSWLSHDTSWVNLDSRSVRRSIKSKPEFLDVIAPQSWEYRTTPTEWIWRASASEHTLLEIATGARRLADIMGTPVATMWFVSMLEGIRSEVLPWYQVETDATDLQDELGPTIRRIEVRRVEDISDLNVTELLASGHIVRIYPEQSLVRSTDLVSAAIAKFRGTEVRVEIVGSPLAHPFYMMRKAGLRVTARASLEPESIEHNKLVRDQVVARIEGRGETAVSFEVQGRARAMLLRRKLVEEALEVLRASSRGETAEELADVEEVLMALREAEDIDRHDVEALRVDKQRRSGGFTEGLVLVTTGGKEADPVEETIPGLEAVPRRIDAATIRAVHGGGISVGLVPPEDRWSAVCRIGRERVRVMYDGTNVVIQPLDHDESSEPHATLF